MTFHIGTPHTRNAGYYFNRYSCDTNLTEDAVQTCSHCQAIIKMSEWKQDGGWCSRCEKPLCNHADCMAQTARLGCVPFIQQLERQIENTIKLEQHLKIAGLEPSPPPRPLIIP